MVLPNRPRLFSLPAGPAAPRDTRRSGRLAVYGGALAGIAAVMPVRLGVVTGDSMTPTLRDGQPFLYAAAGSRPAPRVDEVVLVRLGGETCIKRVFALPGEEYHLMCSGGPQKDIAPGLLERGADLAGWRRRYPALRFVSRRVPPGHVFLLGDNISSVDSRQLGPVALDQVVGRVVSRVGPPPTGENAVVWTAPPPRPRFGALRPHSRGGGVPSGAGRA